MREAVRAELGKVPVGKLVKEAVSKAIREVVTEEVRKHAAAAVARAMNVVELDEDEDDEE